ncbi:NAD(P)/FAD-dependent oxidoreductase [Nostoc sp. FACHB-110]|uniref:NAD(P)/FAD-dependent oxidoreductase n=1 Tax=Nostoc sp. FACHB-110 TaxID=2692834 RepID=UPI001688D094|nr:NAD(P)/FAD-dependent oxidoreductase [Nostoc sp. FACHB-110]MBD2439599.1 tryptophan 7-halogenase [Nostoc sp. FACHB-110]
MEVGLEDVSNPDVLVVGGGPAGCASAITCAQLGLKVVLIESRPFPRTHPGETLHPGVEPLLKQLGVLEQVLEAGFLRHTGNWVQWSGAREFVRFGADDSGVWLGFQAWRADFDAILLHQAKAIGVKVLQPCYASHLLMDGCRVIGVETSLGTFRAAKIIDAAGSNHWLAQKLGLEIRYHSPRLIAYYGYVAGECSARDIAPAIVADSCGWTWTAKVRPQLYQWTRLSLGKQKIPQDWLPNEFVGLKIAQKMRASDVSWRIVRQSAGNGYFIVGDAAMTLDPTSSHGVLKAIMSGIWVGHSIASEFLGNLTERQAIEQYCLWIHNWFQHDVKNLTQLYSQSGVPFVDTLPLESLFTSCT